MVTSELIKWTLQILRRNTRKLHRNDIEQLVERCEQSFLTHNKKELFKLLAPSLLVEVILYNNGIAYNGKPHRKESYKNILTGTFEKTTCFKSYRMSIVKTVFTDKGGCDVVVDVVSDQIRSNELLSLSWQEEFRVELFHDTPLVTYMKIDTRYAS